MSNKNDNIWGIVYAEVSTFFVHFVSIRSIVLVYIFGGHDLKCVCSPIVS